MAKSGEIFRRFSLYITTICVFAIIYVAAGSDPEEWNGIDPETDKTLLEKFFNRLYFTTITFSTIGYGDISPKSNKLRALTILFALAMIIEFFTFIFETKWNTN
tara:strand:+ start:1572 stop:1883 length:312 start_codon:yes stop_codon:yes gene_type:complete